jgi:hypothetical protein
MLTQVKKQMIVDKMYKLNPKARSEFGKFLAKEFTDDDLRDLSQENADKLLQYLETI